MNADERFAALEMKLRRTQRLLLALCLCFLLIGAAAAKGPLGDLVCGSLAVKNPQGKTVAELAPEGNMKIGNDLTVSGKLTVGEIEVADRLLKAETRLTKLTNQVEGFTSGFGKYTEKGSDAPGETGCKPVSDGNYLVLNDVLICWGSKVLPGENHVRDFEFKFGQEFAERPSVSIATDGGTMLPPVAPLGFTFTPYRSKVTTTHYLGTLVDRMEKPSNGPVWMSYTAIGKAKKMLKK